MLRDSIAMRCLGRSARSTCVSTVQAHPILCASRHRLAAASRRNEVIIHSAAVGATSFDEQCSQRPISTLRHLLQPSIALMTSLIRVAAAAIVKAREAVELARGAVEAAFPQVADMKAEVRRILHCRRHVPCEFDSRQRHAGCQEPIAAALLPCKARSVHRPFCKGRILRLAHSCVHSHF